MPLLEVACFRPEDAITAHKAGADRIELCDNRAAGGVTPPRQWLEEVRRATSNKIPVFVMIRPRGGDFCYSDAEFDLMKHEVDHYKKHGADGLVFGILGADGAVDVTRTAELVSRAQPLPCTFHRAFDETPDLLRALEDVVESGCKAILTSGSAATVPEGVEMIGRLVKQARKRVIIVPGGGVRSANISVLRASTHATVFHSSGIISGADEPSFAEVQAMKAKLYEADSETSASQHVQPKLHE